MLRSVAMATLLAGLLTACSGFGSNEGAGSAAASGPGSSLLITRHSLGGVELGQSQTTVEQLTGSGDTVTTHSVAGKEVEYAVPGGQLTVVYGSLFTGDPAAVLTAFTDSSQFRTSDGV